MYNHVYTGYSKFFEYELRILCGQSHYCTDTKHLGRITNFYN